MADRGGCATARRPLLTFGLPSGYHARTDPEYFDDADLEVVWQPDVYRTAASLAGELGCAILVDVGCGRAAKAIATGLRVVGIDRGPNIEACAHLRGLWIDYDLEDGMPALPANLYSSSVVVCADVVEHLRDPHRLLEALAVTGAPATLISTPDRDLVRGSDDLGPPANRAHVREWTAGEFGGLLAGYGMEAELSYTIDNDRDRRPTTILATVLAAA